MDEPCRRRPLLAMRAQQAASVPQQPEAVVHVAPDGPSQETDVDDHLAPIKKLIAETMPALLGEVKVRKKPGPKPGSKRKAR